MPRAHSASLSRHRVLTVLPLALAAALVLGACGSGTPTLRTVTVDATVTGSGSAAGSSGSTADPSGTGVTVPSDTAAGSGAASTGESAPASSVSSEPSPPPPPPPSPSVPETTPPAPFQPVDPLKNDCAALLNAADVKRELNADIADTRGRIVDVANPDRGITGRIKCLYGLGPDGKTGDVTINLTQYADAAAATAQVDLTVTTESGLGARPTDVTVQGYPAHVLIREGGLFVMQYDTWTLSIVVANGKADDPTLVAGLPKLGETVLARVLKNA